jgi:Tfp pilus assembly PilM family ATPase
VAPDESAERAVAEVAEDSVDAPAQEPARGGPDGEEGLSYEQMLGVGSPSDDGPDAELVTILENGVREISGEVRNSLDFHRSQDGGGEVSHIVLSGGAQDLPGFAEALQASLGVEVRSSDIGLVDEHLADTVSPHRLAVATGLAAAEVAQ